MHAARRCLGNGDSTDTGCRCLDLFDIVLQQTRRNSYQHHGIVRYDMVWHGMAWYGMVRYPHQQYGMLWHGMAGFGTRHQHQQCRNHALCSGLHTIQVTHGTTISADKEG